MGEDEARGEMSRRPVVRSSGRPVVALATACGGGVAVVRLSGDGAFAIASAEELPLVPWTLSEHTWARCPCRVLAMPGPRTFTGCDTVEIQLPGSRDVVELAVQRLVMAGAEPAAPGAFTRLAVAHGRLRLDQAEAVLALVHAADASAAAQALTRLRGVLGEAVASVRARLIAARAQVEAGLDFLDEDDVRAYDPTHLRAELTTLAEVLAGFRRTADAEDGAPLVALVGSPNAGKSALFARLTGEPALISPLAGTTRDWLEGTWLVAGRPVRLIDTAGWLDHSLGARPSRPASLSALDARASQHGQARLAGASLILACTAPDAPLPASLPATIDQARVVIIATKADLGPLPAAVAVSAHNGQGLDDLARLVATRLCTSGGGDQRQQRLLATAHGILSELALRLPEDALLADDLRRAADACGELIGATTSDDVLDAVFSRFCIGK
jgi:tRNA modification GTPase